MGLDIMCECGKQDIKVGSYSGVHRLRVAWILAEALHQEDQVRASSMRSAIVSESEVDYDIFNKINGWLPGTLAFVYHSDCDGSWSVSEIRDIIRAVKILFPHLKTTMPAYFDGDEFYLEEILAHCARNGEMIHFC